MLSSRVVFHDWQQKFFLHIDVWSEACSSGLVPSSTGLCKESLAQHKALQERYQLMYNTTRTEGHRLIEKLKKPVGESSVPAKFVMGSRHVKETLENLFDESTGWESSGLAGTPLSSEPSPTTSSWTKPKRCIRGWGRGAGCSWSPMPTSEVTPVELRLSFSNTTPLRLRQRRSTVPVSSYLSELVSWLPTGSARGSCWRGSHGS
ncbi:hypothetical protein GBAR_LOCUS5023 [Geodia barretti]|uniref:Uncharacterized protein n=1 Tax=Geodia barretti TaxID=519541 RepID=A0AA35R8Z9_GEOBA|nr:hypothetical protein GBAR_LOCUS5023 [Geodia barretti]